MNCPKCGLQTLPDQKFCRSCGAGLQLTTQPLAGQATISEPEKSPAIIVKNNEERPNGLVLWGFMMMFIGVAISVIGKKLLYEDIVTVIGILISLAGMFLTAYPYLAPSPRKRDATSQPSRTEVLPRSQPAKQLQQDSGVEYVPSITERTTDLLKSPATTTPREKEDH